MDTPGPPKLAAFQTASSVKEHDHAVMVYETDEALRAGLAHFLHEGLSRGDLCVFVHGFDSDDDAWRFIDRAMPGETFEERVIVVSIYAAAFEGSERRIDREHVTRVIAGLIERASAGSYAGTRLFVDASRRYLSEGRGEEWFALEEWLGRRLHADVGLVCAYRSEDVMRPEVLADVLRTHAYRFEATAS